VFQNVLKNNGACHFDQIESQPNDQGPVKNNFFPGLTDTGRLQTGAVVTGNHFDPNLIFWIKVEC
jgi:hypothetical protein